MRNYCTVSIVLILGFAFQPVDCEDVPCGEPTFQPVTTRVVGGHEAKPGSWPWMVMLAELGVLVCGGSILNDQFVLTAAHCFEDSLSRQPERWQAYVGKHHIDYMDASEAIHNIKEIILHPGFDNVSMKNDLALLRLQDSIVFNDYVKPICVPPTRRRVVPFNTPCYTTGWGDTRGTGDRSVLNQVMLPIINDFFCGRLDWYGYRFIRGLTFCAGYMGGGRDACTGDSGGPFNCKKDGKWYVQGVTSWGYDCGQPKWPGIYTDVSKYSTWIHETMLNSGHPLPD